MHNGFMEALYNNGLVGLIILVAIHLVIVKNLWRALKRSPNRKAHLLAVGSWAVYVNLLINGFFNATFGGPARSAFMLLLGLLVVSEALRRNAQSQAV
jgi:O-antigen ligase